MDLKTHLNISTLLMENLTRTTRENLAAFWFRLGSITPDINPYHRVQPHHARHSKKHIEKYLNKISEGSAGPKRLSYYLGITSHFLSDTFCLMHNHASGKNPRRHYRYERDLSGFFKSFSDIICFRAANQNSPFDEAKGQQLIDYILNENRRYSASQKNKADLDYMTTDITYTVHMCLNVLTEMLMRNPFSAITEKTAA